MSKKQTSPTHATSLKASVLPLLALSGKRSQALAQYETCRRLVSNELGVEPSKETQALYESIRAGDLERVYRFT